MKSKFETLSLEKFAKCEILTTSKILGGSGADTEGGIKYTDLVNRNGFSYTTDYKRGNLTTYYGSQAICGGRVCQS